MHAPLACLIFAIITAAKGSNLGKVWRGSQYGETLMSEGAMFSPKGDGYRPACMRLVNIPGLRMVARL